MELQAFAREVERMRLAQREYFASRDPGKLDEARRREQVVDGLIVRAPKDHELTRQVASLRAAQRYWFTTLNTAALPDCRRRERVVDRLVREALEGRQGELFAQEEETTR